jgi:hypothetical protein
MAEVSIRTFVHPSNSAHPNGTTSLELHWYARILNDGTRYATPVLSRQQILHLFRRLSTTTTSFSLHSKVRIIWLLWRTCAPKPLPFLPGNLRQNMDRTLRR